MPLWISPLKDAIHHINTKTDKTSKLEVKYINAVKGKAVSDLIHLFKIINTYHHFLVSEISHHLFLGNAQRCFCTTY